MWGEDGAAIGIDLNELSDLKLVFVSGFCNSAFNTSYS